MTKIEAKAAQSPHGRGGSLYTGFDHMSPPIGPDGTPYEFYEALRDEATVAPVGWSEAHNGFWLVAGYDECWHIMQNTDAFSNDAVTFPAYETGEKNKLMLAGMDEPLHKKYRSLVAAPFSPAKVAEFGTVTAVMTNQLIDSFIAEGRADVAKAVGDDVPGRVTAILLGLPEEDGDTYREWTFAMAHLFFTDPEAAGAIVGEMHQYFVAALEERKRNPGEDVLSLVIRSELDGERLTDEELLGFFIVLLIGGIENTARLINDGLWRLAWDVELRRRLIARPELIPTAVDELLRYYTPAPVGRLVLEDITVGGVDMKKGQIALTMLPVANRDGKQFPYPDVLIPDRTPNRHIALGTGIHRCLGIHLLRVEAVAAFTEFLRRVPEFELDRERPAVWSTGQVAGMAEVPIVFPPGEPLGA